MSWRQGGHSLQFHKVSAPTYHIDQEKPELHCHHAILYLEHVVSSMNSPSRREKFNLLSTVWFVLQKLFMSVMSLQMDFLFAMWPRFCATLFGFDSTDIKMDRNYHNLMHDPTQYIYVKAKWEASSSRCHLYWYRHITETKSHVPEPILSHRLACLAITCMQHLYQESNTSLTQDHHQGEITIVSRAWLPT